jgi:K+-sensing histidine kinase KdpD
MRLNMHLLKHRFGWKQALRLSAKSWVLRHYQGVLVGDTGPGIPPSDQPHIFQRQYRGIQTQGPIAGTGLGLAIVQDLVQRMQGHVEVYSPLQAWPGAANPDISPDAYDRGTIFVVWLPLANVPLAQTLSLASNTLEAAQRLRLL